ncbi:hypothetical protein JYU34_009740 [Plutella xylostella]|uniref:Uncharacterized protein n=1 Tax=Plutella xylostella TaxID=51655 RepID=A0ABQ7QK89_PLUXY|nr:hypothetical protein JYU34_009740 [Plutella xylostella]
MPLKTAMLIFLAFSMNVDLQILSNGFFSSSRCLTLSKKLHYAKKQIILNRNWTGVFTFGDIMDFERKCYVINFAVPTPEVIQQFYNDINEHMIEPPAWESAELLMTFSDDNNMTSQALLVSKDKYKNKMEPGVFYIVPERSVLDTDMDASLPDWAKERVPLFQVILKLIRISSGPCKSNFLVILACDAGILIATEVQGDCPTLHMIRRVLDSLDLDAPGYLTCIVEPTFISNQSKIQNNDVASDMN